MKRFPQNVSHAIQMLLPLSTYTRASVSISAPQECGSKQLLWKKSRFRRLLLVAEQQRFYIILIKVLNGSLVQNQRPAALARRRVPLVVLLRQIASPVFQSISVTQLTTLATLKFIGTSLS